MSAFLAIIIFPVHFLLQILNLAFWGSAIILMGIVKLFPIPGKQRIIAPFMNFLMQMFGILSMGLLKIFNPVEIDLKINGQLSKKNWYLMIANHLSYLDIVLLIAFSYRRVPAPKFFLKKELIWMPFIGLGAWALDMPFMQRYSRAFLEKHPHLRGKDIETTKKSCGKFTTTPTTVINFVEGTRFSASKKENSNGQFERVLPPRAGGIAFTLATMGELFTDILDVTIQYPDNPKYPMIDMLCGRMTKIVLHVDIVPVTDQVVGDYFNDTSFKARFQAWLNERWQRKDQYIDRLFAN